MRLPAIFIEGMAALPGGQRNKPMKLTVAFRARSLSTDRYLDRSK